MSDVLKAEKERWEASTLADSLARFPERRAEFKTASDLPVERVCTPLDVESLSYLDDLGFPGEYPYARGIQPTMYRGRLWTMRQYAGYASAEESNRRFHYLLQHGQTGLSIAFDLPTQIGYDSDDPIAAGEVGKVGVAIDSLDDMEALLDGIRLDEVSTSMTINATAAILLAMYVAVAKKQGVSPAKLDGTVQNDILKEYVARGTYIFPPRPSLRVVTDLVAYCSEHLPNWNTISISGYHIREAGATAVQELAFTFANAIAYVEAAVQAGLSVDSFAPRLSFFFSADKDFLEEIAKFRAARRIWARIMCERFRAKDPRSRMLRFHTQTAGSSLTAQQPENNVVRTTIEAVAAVLGGTQSLHTNSMDEALALPSERAARLALRTQQIIASESGVVNTIDPLAGSYHIEALTSRIERDVADYLARVEGHGGTLPALEKGYFQREIHESAYRHQCQVDSGERIVVGVNQFVVENGEPVDILRVDPGVREAQVSRLMDLRGRRDAERAARALDQLRQAALADTNLMPVILDCVERLCTIGEICHTLRKVFGEFREVSII
ncbi:MAG: methylmalonyl-CoA mutase family protein [Chloroflexi bacterium]|nr:methylmalonyl-CoA mutase family protein [Chloroflexota bacterium]